MAVLKVIKRLLLSSEGISTAAIYLVTYLSATLDHCPVFSPQRELLFLMPSSSLVHKSPASGDSIRKLESPLESSSL